MGYTKHLLPTLSPSAVPERVPSCSNVFPRIVPCQALYSPLFASPLLRRLYADCVVTLSH